ncbi:hypothetical protein Fcan01_16941 [Folsomia candida]|uniref:Uncharacterized protein n=1 Tax=Folsomia candida TaxID=158441 RepID=A0A226DRX5_FOLCA|nr:hypothetical protein Fcan01_16941 [Folsomia candida]
MYSKRVVIAWDACLKVSSLFGASELLLDSGTKRFYTKPYSRRNSQFNTILIIIQITFGASSLFQLSNLSNTTDYELCQFNFSYVILLAIFVPLICFKILATNCEDLVDGFNQALNYIFRVREIWVSLTDEEIASSYQTGNVLGWFFASVAVLVAGYSFFGGVAIYLIRILPFQWMSLILPKFRSQTLFCVHLGCYAHLLIISICTVGIALTIVASYVAATSWSIVSTKYLTIFSVFGKGGSLSDKEIASSYPTGTYLEWFFGSIAGLVAGYSFFGGVAIYVMDILPFHWTSLVPKKFRSRVLFCVHLGFYGYLLIISIVSAGIGIVIVAFYVAFVIPFNSEFDLNRKSGKYITYSSFRTTAILPMEYRCLELIHRRVMSHFSLAIVPFQAVVHKFTLFCNWMLLAHWESLGILRYLMIIAEVCTVAFCAEVLQTCGKFYAQSIKNRASWRPLGEDKYFRKWRKSVTPLYFGPQGYHVIRRLSILKFWKAIIRGTVRTVVTMHNV